MSWYSNTKKNINPSSHQEFDEEIYTDINFIPHPYYDSNKHTIINVSVPKTDKFLSHNKEFYVGSGGKGGFIELYSGIKNFLKDNKKIQIPYLDLTENYDVGFIDGRHRWAFLRDLGFQKLPVMIKKEKYPLVKAKLI